jgi:hypothetical protein
MLSTCWHAHAARPSGLPFLARSRSYKYLALATLAAAAFISWLTGVALTLRPDVTSVWLCILLFFVIRFCSSAGRIFSGRGGFGQWGGDRAAVVSR